MTRTTMNQTSGLCAERDTAERPTQNNTASNGTDTAEPDAMPKDSPITGADIRYLADAIAGALVYLGDCMTDGEVDEPEPERYPRGLS